MAYDNPLRRIYYFTAVNFGGDANVVHEIPVPVRPGQTQGRSGRVTTVLISDITEDFTGDVSDAGVRVGDGSDDDKYYDTGLAGLTETVDVGEEILQLVDDGAKVDIELGRSTLTVTFVAGSTTETGIATVGIEVEWD
jgi:hypothetical protein